MLLFALLIHAAAVILTEDRSRWTELVQRFAAGRAAEAEGGGRAAWSKIRDSREIRIKNKIEYFNFKVQING